MQPRADARPFDRSRSSAHYRRKCLRFGLAWSRAASRISSGRPERIARRSALAIADAAQRTGASFAYLLNQAKSESGLNPNAKAGTSSATGLYQFIDQSWLGVLKQHGAEHGYGWAADAIKRRARRRLHRHDPAARQAIFALRRDPTASALMAGEYAQDNAAGLQSALGREVELDRPVFRPFPRAGRREEVPEGGGRQPRCAGRLALPARGGGQPQPVLHQERARRAASPISTR